MFCTLSNQHTSPLKPFGGIQQRHVIIRFHPIEVTSYFMLQGLEEPRDKSLKTNFSGKNM